MAQNLEWSDAVTLEEFVKNVLKNGQNLKTLDILKRIYGKEKIENLLAGERGVDTQECEM